MSVEGISGWAAPLAVSAMLQTWSAAWLGVMFGHLQ